MKKQVIKSVVTVLLALVIVIYCIILIAGGAEVKTGIDIAIERCLNVIIPSLFAFMALSSFVVSSGLYGIISKPFSIFSKYIMGIPPQLFFVFLMGSVAGYPIGIKLLSDLVKEEKIDERTAKIMSVSCFCGGPAFYSGTIGLAIFGNINAGLLIFVSITISNFVISTFMGHFFKPKINSQSTKMDFSAQIFTNSVTSAGKSLFTICIMIIFFSTIMSVFDYLNLLNKIQELTGCSDNILVLIKSSLEITSITELSGSPYNLLPFISAVCSFGGVCVLVQVIAINENSFSLKYFFLSRIPCALLSAGVCKLMKYWFIPAAVEVNAQVNKTFVKVNNFIPSICLILMILLLNYKKRLVISNAV